MKNNKAFALIEMMMVVAVVSIFGMVFFVGFVTGFIIGKDNVEQKAVKQGVAFYMKNYETGESTFTWLGK